MSAADLLRERIWAEGPIPFRDFMEEALYGEQGYYASGGRAGEDFQTGPEAHPAFAEAFAHLFLDAGIHRVVEAGAGTGTFAERFVAVYEERGEPLEYVAVERSRRARRNLEELDLRVEEDLGAVEGFEGALFSNELVDALPVHVVEKRSDGLKEVYVDHDDGFVEVLRDAPDELEDYFDWLGVELPEGFRTEVNLDALDWLDVAAEVLESGAIVTVDYGEPSEELYSEGKSEGTVICFRGGVAFEDPYREVGERDVTARVNFSALERRGRELGLEPEGPYRQREFLEAAGIEEVVQREMARRDLRDFSRWFSPLKKLISPVHMGDTHKVLVQKKGFPIDLVDAPEV